MTESPLSFINMTFLYFPTLYAFFIILSKFQALIAPYILARDPLKQILLAFILFDKDGKGKINLEDLQSYGTRAGLAYREKVVGSVD